MSLGAETSLAQRLQQVRDRIAAAALAVGREPAEVRLIAVSKTKPAEAVRAAYAAGARDFGENYVQELRAKAEALADLVDLRFHLIGHLQRNKARVVVEHSSVVQTVDNVRLVEELGKRTANREVPLEKRFPGAADRGELVVLVEVNVGGEAQKSGCAPSDLGTVLDAIDRCPSLRLRGLMTVPPVTEDPAAARGYFEQLRALRDRHGGTLRLPELSMGMSDDLEAAIAAGATMVRVGTAIFGARTPRTSDPDVEDG